MSGAWVIALCALAAAATVAVHWLYRGSAKSLEVATLEPFADLIRPRLRLTRLRERWLLLLRLALLGAIGLAMLGLLNAAPAARFGSDVVLVVPGTATDVVDELTQAHSDVRWLDDGLTAIADEPTEGDWIGALLAADQRIPLTTTIRVAGAASARDWPVRAPVTRREIEWLPSRPLAAASPALWPRSLHLIADDEAHRVRLENVVAIWRAAGLLQSASLAWDDAGMAASDALIWWRDGALPARAFGVTLGDQVDAPPGWRVIESADTLTDAALADVLWRALIRFEAVRPTEVAVATLATQVEPRLRVGSARSQDGRESTSWLWWLVVLLFCVERLMALRAVRR